MSAAARTDEPEFEIDGVMDFRSPRLRALWAWWSAKSAALGRMPSRADLNPRDVQDALSNMALFDVLDGPPFALRNRLVGSAIARFAAESGRAGTAWDASHPNPIAPRYIASAIEVARRRAPVRMRSRQAATPEVRFAQGENFFAPLSTDGERIDMLLTGADLLVEDGAGGVRSLLTAAL